MLLSALSLLCLNLSSLDIDACVRAFRLLDLASQSDGGKLWGQPIAGPMLIVDPTTRSVVANVADREGKLRQSGGLFVGEVPANLPLANTSSNWAGQTWAMVLWPLPKSPVDLTNLLVHESWHRIQPSLGTPFKDSSNGHLDEGEGRRLLRLELRALAVALEGKGESRKAATQDALAFRAERYRKYSAAKAEEDALEWNEGLAEYTGQKLRGTSDAETARELAHVLRAVGVDKVFPRSFAYLTGPAYGLLLDPISPDWRSRVRTQPLSDLLRTAIGQPDWRAIPQSRSANRYDGPRIGMEERTRAAENRKKKASLTELLVNGPIVSLPLNGGGISFDPRSVFPLDDRGTVYMILTVTANWGKLTVTKAALVTKDWSTVVVPAPHEGNGWTLQLEPGWKLEKDPKTGTRTLVGPTTREP